MYRLLLLHILLLATLMGAFARNHTAADPVVMKIDKQQVRLSEFEYFYRKNNAQMLDSIDARHYLTLFIDYKLKVAEALTERIDTTQAFIDEFEAYSRELAAMPADSASARELDCLLKEYHDGLLLFEVSSKNVWERANNDTEGLNAYFEANRDKYAWDVPRYKGLVLCAGNDSILTKAVEFAQKEIEGGATDDALADGLKTQYGESVKLRRIVAAKGDNPISDFLGWDVPYAGKVRVAALRQSVISAPESMADVRSQVLSDYQASLESAWLGQLRKKHKVKVYTKRLKHLL